MEQTTAITKLREFFQTHRRLPSYKEMCELFGFASKNASYQLVKKLIEAGVLEKDLNGKLVPKKLNVLPNLGTIQAGFLTTAEEQNQDMVSFDDYLVGRPQSSFVLRVSGDSMVDAGIQPDDLVVIEKTHAPKNGDIVAACVDNECTLKYYRNQNGEIMLIPANPNYRPIKPNGNFMIYGKVVSLVRKY